MPDQATLNAIQALYDWVEAHKDIPDDKVKDILQILDRPEHTCHYTESIKRIMFIRGYDVGPLKSVYITRDDVTQHIQNCKYEMKPCAANQKLFREGKI